MKINIHQTIKSLDGEDLTFGGEIVTVGSLAQRALKKTSSEKYEKKIDLAKRFMTTDNPMSIKAEEIALIKDSVKQLPVTAELVYQFEQTIDPVEEEGGQEEEE